MTFTHWLQSRLSAHGCALDADGDWGRASIEALKSFQKRMGLPVTGVADDASVAALRRDPEGAGALVSAPVETMPPWMAEMYRRMGLHEVRNKAKLIDFLKIGKFLGDPERMPWCGDAVESCIAKALPTEPLPANPFFAQAWASFGVDAGGPVVGAIGIIRWSESSGHVGIVANSTRDSVTLLGGNQSNAIKLSSFARAKFIAFRWPSTFPIKRYPPLSGDTSGMASVRETR